MKLKFISILLGAVLLSGCSSFFRHFDSEERNSSSLVRYLYPDGNYQAHEVEVPTLHLPVRVGLAFVPDNNPLNSPISPQQEIDLLQSIRTSFRQYDFVDRIEIIPSTYLANSDGFDSLQQIARLHDVDIMALVSYDQISRSHMNNASLFYWTIVGAYLVPGDTNVTRTFVDTAVFDVDSRKLLFRAPGTNKVHRFATAVGASNQARVSSENGFQDAVAEMSLNLEHELARFRQRVAEEKIVQVQYRNGYSGGSSPDLLLLLLLAAVLALRRLPGRVR